MGPTRTRTKSHRLWDIVVVAAILGVAFTAVAILALTQPRMRKVIGRPSLGDKPFDRTVWLAGENVGAPDFPGSATARWNPRGPMVADLRRRHLPQGMTRADVRRLLGRPMFTDVAEAGGSTDRYSIGYGEWLPGLQGSPSTGYVLAVHYDRSGRVRGTQIMP
jgi:hypothetical protein